MLTKQMLFHLIYIPYPLLFSYGWDMASHFCPGLAPDDNPPPYTSQIQGFTGMDHHVSISLHFSFHLFCNIHQEHENHKPHKYF
jgi:hypothetical protein